MSDSETILETRKLTKTFGGFTAVSDVNLKVRKGEIHALIGPNGAGKTTLFNLLTRFMPASEGDILFDGRSVSHTPPARVAQLGMVRSFQISAVFPEFTSQDNVAIGLQRRRRHNFDFWGAPGRLGRYRDEARHLLGQVGLTEFADTPARFLPYGRKRALELATTLALDPRLILLDEPTAGMTAADIGQVTQLIRQVGQNKTILMVEHNLAVVADLSDRISVLVRGQILIEGTYREVSKDPRVMEAYMGTSPSPEDATC